LLKLTRNPRKQTLARFLEPTNIIDAPAETAARRSGPRADPNTLSMLLLLEDM